MFPPTNPSFISILIFLVSFNLCLYTLESKYKILPIIKKIDIKYLRINNKLIKKVNYYPFSSISCVFFNFKILTKIHPRDTFHYVRFFFLSNSLKIEFHNNQANQIMCFSNLFPLMSSLFQCSIITETEASNINLLLLKKIINK